MRKPVLGKGLRSLLNGTTPPGAPSEPPSCAERSPKTSISPGVGTLLRGEGRPTKPHTEAAPESGPPAFADYWPKVRWLLFGADLLLLSLASLLVFKHPQPLNFFEWVICVLSLVIGAALALIGLLIPSRQKGKLSNRPADEVTTDDQDANAA